MAYICRWCERNFEDFNKKINKTQRGNEVLSCPRCGNMTYGFLFYKDGNWMQF